MLSSSCRRRAQPLVRFLRPMRFALILVLGAPVGLSTACRHDKNKDTRRGEENPALPASRSIHTVLIADDGFDLTHPALADRVAASFEIRCRPPEPDATGMPGSLPPSDYAAFKASALEKLRSAQSSASEPCTISPLTPVPPSPQIAAISPIRTSWNRVFGPLKRQEWPSPLAAQQALQGVDGPTVERIISSDRTGNSYHGLMTSSVIGWNNPSVRVVLLNITLGDGSLPQSDSGQGPTCPGRSLQQLRWYVQLLDESDYRQAVLADAVRPSEVAKKLSEIVDQYGVTMVNQSFGAPPFQVLAAQYVREGGCPQAETLQWAALMETKEIKESEIDRARSDRDPTERNVLSVIAAGNDSLLINIGRDAETCISDRDSRSIIVGSSNSLTRRVASHSNFGSCVDVYAPGADIVAAAADGFYLPVTGTSFAAPMLARWISQNIPPSTQPEEVVSRVRQLAGPSGILPLENFPEELQFSLRTPSSANAAMMLTDEKAPLEHDLRQALKRAETRRWLVRNLGL